MEQVGRTNTERRYWADKKREQKLALIPLLQADEDLCWIGCVLARWALVCVLCGMRAVCICGTNMDPFFCHFRSSGATARRLRRRPRS